MKIALKRALVRCGRCGEEYDVGRYTKALIGITCPVCGEVMLTDYDWKELMRLKRVIRLFNTFAGIFGPDDGPRKILTWNSRRGFITKEEEG